VPSPSASASLLATSSPGGPGPQGGSTGGGSGTGRAGGAGTIDPQALTVAAGAGTDHIRGPEIDGLSGAVATSFVQLGIAGWSVPAVVVGVPGVLVLVVVALQLLGAASWLPFARRNLGSDRSSRRQR
jgi:hypothetical protein